MSRALIDVPHCMDVAATYVGPASEIGSRDRGGPATWIDASRWGGTAAFRVRAVTECLDTVAVLRAYREPLEGETWLRPAESERRLLAQVNAIIALGPEALKQVSVLALDPAIPDAARVFAGIFVLASVAGPDWLARAREIFVRAAARSGAEAAAGTEALGLAPHASIGPMMDGLLDDVRPRVRAAAIRVLSYRGELSETAWSHAVTHPDPSIVAAALSVPPAGYDAFACARALEPILEKEGPETLVRLALRAGVAVRSPAARTRAIQIARRDPSWADAALVIAWYGNVGDVEHIRAMLTGPWAGRAMEAAATLGSSELIPDLLALLDHEGVAEEATGALNAITGLAFSPNAGSARARRLWAEHATRFPPAYRFREGSPLSLESFLQRLWAGPGSRSIRQTLYLEILAATASAAPRFSPYDFVAVQAMALRRIGEWLTESRRAR